MMLLPIAGLMFAAAVGSVPSVAPRVEFRAVADSDAVLTVEALTNMTTFWTSFLKQPDAIKTTGRQANQKPLTVMAGSKPLPIKGVVNMEAMATKFPPVAADLKQANLTAAQWEAYRKSLMTVVLAKLTGATGIDASSVLGKNIAFIDSHEKEFEALKASGMWFPKPQPAGGGMGGGGGDLNP